MTICNLGAEIGATCSVFPYDDKMADYLRATSRADIAKAADAVKEHLRPDDGALYDKVIEIDLSTLKPLINGPHSPDRAHKVGSAIGSAAQLNNWPVEISSALIGSCTNSSYEDITRAAVIYATGGAGMRGERPENGYGPSLIYSTVAHLAEGEEDAGAIAAACIDLAILTGNLGRAGGGVATPRGPANSQGVVDMGAHPVRFPGGHRVADPEIRARFEAAWLARWGDRATTSNGFVPVRTLHAGDGHGIDGLVAAIERGDVTAMYIENTVAGRHAEIDPRLYAVLPKLEFLVVADHYADTPLGRLADVILPLAMSMEKDGTFTSFDRTVQRLRQAIPPMGEAKSGIDIVASIARRMGYGLEERHAAQVMTEISRLVSGYGGVTYARLERGGITVPTGSFADEGAAILAPGGEGMSGLAPAFSGARA